MFWVYSPQKSRAVCTRHRYSPQVPQYNRFNSHAQDTIRLGYQGRMYCIYLQPGCIFDKGGG